LLTLLICWKGGSAKIDLTDNQAVGVAFGVGGVVAVIIATFFIPFLHRKIIVEDWELKSWEVIKGPLLLRRPQPGPRPEGHHGIRDFYAGHLTAEQLEAKRAAEAHAAPDDVEKGAATSVNTKDGSDSDISPLPSVTPAHVANPNRQLSTSPVKCPPPGPGTPPPSPGTGSNTAPCTA
jgi:sodium-dependent phosphate transporter